MNLQQAFGSGFVQAKLCRGIHEMTPVSCFNAEQPDAPVILTAVEERAWTPTAFASLRRLEVRPYPRRGAARAGDELEGDEGFQAPLTFYWTGCLHCLPHRKARRKAAG